MSTDPTPATPAGRRLGSMAALVLVLALLAACSSSGGSDPKRDRAAGTPAERRCQTIPPAPRGDAAGSVDEPFEAERYSAGTAMLRIEDADGAARCLTLQLDGARGRGWDHARNQIDLAYGPSGGPSIRLRTRGEPMVGSVDSTLDVDAGAADWSLDLSSFPDCSFLLVTMAEHRLEGWIDCPTPGRGAPAGTASVRGHLTVTA